MDITRFSERGLGHPFRPRWGYHDMFDDLHNRMDQIMDMMVTQPSGIGELRSRETGTESYPLKVDVRETENEFILKADVPGIPKEDIKIQITDDGTVSISGERRSETTVDQEGYYKVERSYGKFSRTFKLPNLKAEDATAKYENGELLLIMPKKALPEGRVRDVQIA
eukprot:TRINITY_DN19004_c1_g1_i2.p1 TRINITY_DN19004_c1_g1~~TRINITY_DN19004_c1_g1_i2.p1  ORF type:complete len:167 (-),score=23.88 TRINITY_DN19004_c1_g1_i2:77-577(-)